MAKSKTLVSFAGYPLVIEGRCLGVVAMFAEKPIEQDTLDYLALAANGIAQNIDRKRAAAELADLNRTLEQRVAERTLELELSEQFNRSTLDALSAHVAVIDEAGSIVATNDAWRKFAVENSIDCKSVGLGANYLQVCDYAAESGDTDARLVAAALREVLAGRRTAWSYEYPCHSPTKRRWFTCQITLCYIKHQPHAVTAHEDVTSIKCAQEELREAKERAVKASLAKSEFLAAMSHELRTPLNGILGMNSLILRTDLNDRQRRFAEACESSGKILTQLINDVLDLSKIEAGKLELDPRQCEIEAIVYDVVDILSGSANQKGISPTCQLSEAACISTRIDDNRFRQILINLVGNAIKFTSSGSVSIKGDLIDLSPDVPRLRIEIVDTGIGIPQERSDRLFKAFSQIDSSTTRYFGGSGLGLSICQQLVDLMGGTIGVESQVGVGSTFWFEIPLANIKRPLGSANPGRSLAGVCAVTINCSDEQQNHIAECMVNWGCQCTHTQSLAQVVGIIQQLSAREVAPVVIAASSRELEKDRAALEQVFKFCRECVVAIVEPNDDVSTQTYRDLGIRVVLPSPVRPSALFDALTSLLRENESGTVRVPPPPLTPPSLNPPPKLSGHLLVAEDNKINQLYIVELLKLLDCTCDIVESGVDVLTALENSHYDLILMDCQMPEMDGYAATREIRKREALTENKHRTPILALTANALKGDRERCLEAGMDEYVKKPIDFENLSSVLVQFLRPPTQ